MLLVTNKMVGLMDVQVAKELAREKLSDERYYHTECVAAKAKQLALQFGEDVNKALIAGYLHDIAKEFEKADLLQMLEASDIIEHDNLLDCPSVWHGHAAAVYLKREFGIDEEIASAICYHTTARANMSLLEKIVFLADCISDDREYEYLDEIKDILTTESVSNDNFLDEALLFTIRKQIERLTKQNRQIHYDSIKAYNYLALLLNK